MVSSGAGGKGASPLVVIDLEPVLLADLLRDELSERGLTVAESADRPGHAAVALLSESTAVALDADVVVRLPEAGQTMPTVVEVESQCADSPRLVVVDDVEVLIDLLVDLADD